jgi:hypothetical protein
VPRQGRQQAAGICEGIPPVTKSGRLGAERLTDQSVCGIVNAYAGRIGFKAADFGAHSLGAIVSSSVGAGMISRILPSGFSMTVAASGASARASRHHEHRSPATRGRPKRWDDDQPAADQSPGSCCSPGRTRRARASLLSAQPSAAPAIHAASGS